MKNANSRLAIETNKLITQTLSREGGVYLPTIGSLSFATLVEDGDTINTIVLNKEERHKSLVKIIEERGNCSSEQAAMLYEKWVEEISEEDGSYNLTTLGVIANGAFVVEPSLYNRLNINSKKRIAEREAEKKAEREAEKIAKEAETKEKRSAESKPVAKPAATKPAAAKPKAPKQAPPKQTPSKQKSTKAAKPAIAKAADDDSKNPAGIALWGFVSVVIIAGIISIFIYEGDFFSSTAASSDKITPASETAIELTTNTPESKVESTTTIEATESVESTMEDVVAAGPTIEAVEEESVDLALKNTPKTMPEMGGRPIPPIKSNDPVERLQATLTESTTPMTYRVVCGIFRSQRNAGRMILDIECKLGERAIPRVYLRDNKYMVTIFEADNFRECSQYISTVAIKHYESTWVYNSKTMD
ncbi:MAG: cell envelope integrity protein TolA [Rikenellaceae bacterium]